MSLSSYESGIVMRKLAVLALCALVAALVLSPSAQADPVNTYVVNDTFSYSASNWEAHSLDCDPGDVVSGGGFLLTSTLSTIRVVGSAPQLDRSGWEVTVNNGALSATDVEIFVVCES